MTAPADGGGPVDWAGRFVADARRREPDPARRWEVGRAAYAAARLARPADRKRFRELALGDGRLTFAVLGDALRWLPYRLAEGYKAGRGLHVTPAGLLPVWFNKPDRLPFVRAWAAVPADPADPADPAGRPVALVFPRKGVPPGLVCYPVTSDPDFGTGPAWVYPYEGENGDVRRLAVQRFDDFLARLATHRPAARSGDHGDY